MLNIIHPAVTKTLQSLPTCWLASVFITFCRIKRPCHLKYSFPTVRSTKIPQIMFFIITFSKYVPTEYLMKSSVKGNNLLSFLAILTQQFQVLYWRIYLFTARKTDYIKKTIVQEPVLLYSCETWSLTLREERRPRVFEKKILRRIFGPKRNENGVEKASQLENS